MSSSEEPTAMPSPRSDSSRSSSGGSNGQQSGDGAIADAQERIVGAARGAADEAKHRAESMYREASDVAAGASDAIDEAADKLEDSGHETLSQAAGALSERVRMLSNYLEDRRLEDLVDDARRLAQRNPGLFIAGGVALGFALSRLLKASATAQTTRTRHIV